jgi:hypothetical protein
LTDYPSISVSTTQPRGGRLRQLLGDITNTRQPAWQLRQALMQTPPNIHLPAGLARNILESLKV